MAECTTLGHNKKPEIMKKILVPIDFSEVSFNAAAFALELARKSKAKLVILHSAYFHYYNEFSYGVSINPQPFIDELEEAIQEKMSDFKAKLKGDVPIEIEVSSLSFLEAMRSVVRDHEIDLIVMGTSGSSGLEEFFIGSNTEKIVRKIDCPVISVPSQASAYAINKILVPLDIHEVQDEWMKNLARLHRFLEASLEFVWVRNPHGYEDEDEVRAKFDKLMEEYEIKNATLGIISNLVPVDGILDYAMESRADMLAMATHAHRGITHLMSGSVTEDTINHISIPVWTSKLDKNSELIDLFESQMRDKALI